LEAATAVQSGTKTRWSPLSKRRSLRITSSELRIEELACGETAAEVWIMMVYDGL